MTAKIVMASSEVVPFSKTGGLGDVLHALPSALAKEGMEVSIFTPFYEKLIKGLEGLRDEGTLKVPVYGRSIQAGLHSLMLENGVKVYFISCPLYFARDALYDINGAEFADNAERFAFFSRGVIEAVRRLESPVDIFHCHDWQSALIPVYLKTKYRGDYGLLKAGTVLTIHNLAYQGVFERDAMNVAELDWSLFTLQKLEFWGRVNFLKGGMVYSDIITTVSRSYAKEIQREESGAGLHGVLAERSDRVFGILNGADYENWDPEKDPHIPVRYRIDDMAGKRVCKTSLQKEMGLKRDPRVPLVGIVSRLVDQKGFDLFDQGLEKMMSRNIQMVVLGMGHRRYHLLFERARERWKGRLSARLAFDNPLAHRIEAGSDIFLMPSRYEPCGLNQMYSLRYGTIPVVRGVGGLDDTIIDYSEDSARGYGFKFRVYSPEGMVDALDRAISAYKDGKVWRLLMKRAMARDFSWQRSAREYIEIYRKAMEYALGPAKERE